jgi:hypothetical protein
LIDVRIAADTISTFSSDIAQYPALTRIAAFHAMQRFDRSAVGAITVVVPRYHRRYRTERN